MGPKHYGDEIIDAGNFGFSPDGSPGQGPVNKWYNVPGLWHRGATFSFADGHSAYRKWREGSTLAITTTTFTDVAPNHNDLRYVQSILATKY
jgi:prepilin-type processing-associated H-X9-DG protein